MSNGRDLKAIVWYLNTDSKFGMENALDGYKLFGHPDAH
jgi:hypothetical protein